MLTQSINTNATVGRKVASLPCGDSDRFGVLTGHAGLIATEFTYRKDEEIYGEDEPAEYVYQVIRGAAERPARLGEARERASQGRAVGHQHRHMEEARGSTGPRSGARPPGEMHEGRGVIGAERRARLLASDDAKPQDVRVEANRTLQIGDRERHVTDVRISRQRPH